MFSVYEEETILNFSVFDKPSKHMLTTQHQEAIENIWVKGNFFFNYISLEYVWKTKMLFKENK